MKTSRHVALAVVITMLITSLPAASHAVVLRFSPADQLIAVGQSGSLSVYLDETIVVRTIELLVSYDPTIVTSLGGEPGQVFSDSGCQLFPVFEEDEPGAWYGGCVTMGPDCYLNSPGELYRWNFEGLADGTCPVQVEAVILYNDVSEVIPDVTLAGTTIIVGTTSMIEMPPAQQLTLSLAPNPFNPRTTIRFDGRQEESVTVEVFDLKGGRVATLWRGIMGSEPGVVQWDGTDQLGREVPGGTYLFRVLGQGDRIATRKGILLK